jgi:hypothetical protein
VKLATTRVINASTMLLLTDGSCYVSKFWWSNMEKIGARYERKLYKRDLLDVAPMNSTDYITHQRCLLMEECWFQAANILMQVMKQMQPKIYDPVRDTWTSISAPAGWGRVGDAACCVLADGRIIDGQLR